MIKIITILMIKIIMIIMIKITMIIVKVEFMISIKIQKEMIIINKMTMDKILTHLDLKMKAIITTEQNQDIKLLTMKKEIMVD